MHYTDTMFMHMPSSPLCSALEMQLVKEPIKRVSSVVDRFFCP